jgi:MOSC domain-containing protein YiiM
VARFTDRGAPGAYLRVIIPGRVCAGDSLTIIHHPGHEVTINLMFRALTKEKTLLPHLLAAGEDLPEENRDQAFRWLNR